jgi:hypothetical protein
VTGKHIVVQSGAEAEIPMTEAYYGKLESILANCNPKPYELSGGGEKAKVEQSPHKNEPSKAEPPKAEAKKG